jgi:polyhydroxyalkanoate synthesis regulator phasin
MQDIQSLEIVKTPRLIFQKWLLITISVALLILLIITVGYISSQRNNQNSNTQIQPTNTIITEPSNTYIYTNNILKYELTLPNGYIVMEDSLVPSDLPQANDVNEMANYRNVRILKKDAQSTDDYAFIIFDYDATDNNDFFNYMKESQAHAVNAVSEIRHAGETISTMNGSVAKISLMTDQVSTSTEEQSIVTEDIHQRISKITDDSKHTVRASEEAEHAVNTLYEKLKALENFVLTLNINQQNSNI